MQSGKTTGCVLSVANQRGGAMPETTTLYDSSRFKNNGTMTAVTWTQLPSGLWVMNFNGTTSQVSCTGTISLQPSIAITISTWVYVSTLKDATEHIVCWRNGGSYAIFKQAAGYFIFFTLYCEGGNELTLTSTAISIGWQHLVATYNGISKNVYKNGISIQNVGAILGSITYSPGSFYLGNKLAASPFEGSQVLTKVFNRALSAAEIRGIYNAEAPLFGIKP
jgi:hypothetical protein